LGRSGDWPPLSPTWTIEGLRGFWLGHPEIATKIGPAIVQAAAMITSGRVHIPVAATYPISSIKQAVAPAQRGGKILLDVAGSST
jgi:hypothetical protein